ncbi:MAG: hypothetical protein AUJ31_00015 [Parcubacteria group bacterium CG1_02_39_15]|uniref:Uncharacterized protein n=4 Tax=Candidatus Nealsoniibacteriota TaxID=1817911 RepID=A0A2G9YTS0_9BACT|nr:MAG: hypothetical protein AUJ31_00015 [Parcubacteria group bacterium CG1_02_39_15]PIP22143.1 MAG: hypothetical protein COX38_02200 [Candidatus Nealsonbacteria bacterium CG23_combo_of_CG06-09_8_20_14_all_39_25]PIQ98580.1 MAG: hypothetical protein COV64_00415 [Candidatus Nealsonbacteria bacterium CG11_big_fil_rev_8_21_14_0_20_39_9]PIW89832.1 MAG: hypothetical protein COZ92_02405 [Candidatus Nealsonbacteria bacterium CG_4_8_14_3_um_filter_40_11]PIZ88038.1 MAG: hypothetical protein COX91_02325 [
MMPILEFHAINPLAIGPFGMSLYFLLMHIPIIGGFGAAAYYIIKYLRRFYGERPIPEEWKFFWLAIVWTTIHEIIEMPILYQWIVGQVLLITFFIIQVIASVYLVRGSYLLAKKYIAR